MNLPRFSVRNPVPINFLMIGVILLGTFSMVSLKREFFPNIEAEQILITVPYPGATPAEIERSVTPRRRTRDRGCRRHRGDPFLHLRKASR